MREIELTFSRVSLRYFYFFLFSYGLFLSYYFTFYSGNIETKVRLKTLADTLEFIIAVQEAKYFQNDDISPSFLHFLSAWQKL